jgi:pyruvate/2-oxoacid:ferredoxin oxidoreductase beta subunit
LLKKAASITKKVAPYALAFTAGVAFVALTTTGATAASKLRAAVKGTAA